MYKTIHHYFPGLKERLNEIEEIRKRTEYEMAELITAGIALFLFKEGSRNAFNLDRKEAKFRENYYRIFKMRPPQMDTVDDLFRLLDETQLERLKAELVSSLIEKKLFRRFKFLGKQYIIAVDATGVVTFDYQHCEHCLTKTHENKTQYFHHVLEAKLITSNGFCISLASEWIYNGQEDYEKQDCEHKAFKRLAAKIKTYYPRLPILITADGLYPNKTFFNICKENGWHFIVTLKDGNLKAIQEEISLLPESQKIKLQTVNADKSTLTTQDYKWVNDIDYHGHKLNWIECQETVKHIKDKKEEKKRFVHISCITIDQSNAPVITFTGRLRWKIENEGFNAQKTEQYLLQHKYSRASFTAMKNFYQCLQIAHLINQLITLSTTIAEKFKIDAKQTVKNLWKRLIAFMLEGELVTDEFADIGRIQIRLA